MGRMQINRVNAFSCPVRFQRRSATFRLSCGAGKMGTVSNLRTFHLKRDYRLYGGLSVSELNVL